MHLKIITDLCLISYLESIPGQISDECLLCLIRWTMGQMGVDIASWQWYWRSIRVSSSQTMQNSFGKIYSWLWPAAFLEQKALARKVEMMAWLALKKSRHLRQTPRTLNHGLHIKSRRYTQTEGKDLCLNGLFQSLQLFFLIFFLVCPECGFKKSPKYIARFFYICRNLD